jgi:hypothetical protein
MQEATKESPDNAVRTNLDLRIESEKNPAPERGGASKIKTETHLY